jgi:20S proteasome subunit alpha 7
MSASGSGYDQSCTTFTSDGRVFQVEYAYKAVQKGGTTVGIRCADGVVLGVESMIASRMLRKGCNRAISTIATHAGLAVAGMSADGRQLVNKGREEAQEYKSQFDHKIPGEVLAGRLAGEVHTHTLYWYLRPYGCSALLASYSNAPELYMIEPNGEFYRYFAIASGKHATAAKSELEKLPLRTITCREAVTEIAKIIYQLHDDNKDKEFELQMSWVCDESRQRHVRVPEDVVEGAIKVALEYKRKAEIDDSESDSEED